MPMRSVSCLWVSCLVSATTHASLVHVSETLSAMAPQCASPSGTADVCPEIRFCFYTLPAKTAVKDLLPPRLHPFACLCWLDPGTEALHMRMDVTECDRAVMETLSSDECQVFVYSHASDQLQEPNRARTPSCRRAGDGELTPSIDVQPSRGIED